MDRRCSERPHSSTSDRRGSWTGVLSTRGTATGRLDDGVLPDRVSAEADADADRDEEPLELDWRITSASLDRVFLVFRRLRSEVWEVSGASEVTS
jgi:hypothetical protein